MHGRRVRSAADGHARHLAPRTHRRPVAVVCGALAFLAATSVPAWAMWSVTGSGPGRAASLSVVGVTTPVAACAAGNKVSVTWTGGATGQTYTVARQVNGGAWTNVASVSTLTYNDDRSAIALGLGVVYRVTPMLATWSGTTTAASNGVVVVVGTLACLS